jgi:hypothetical protein
MARQGSPSISSSTRSAARHSSSGVGGSPERQLTAMENVYNKLISDFQETATKQAVISRTADQPENEGGGWLGGLAHSPVGGLLRNLNRLPNALFQGEENLAGQEEQRGYSPSDLLHSLGNFGSGLKEGFFYEDGYSGAGQVYEALKENPTSSTGRGLSALEEAHPNWEQALAISAGAAGEIFGDPYNLIMPAAPSVMKGTRRVLSREAIEETTQAATRTALENAMASNPAMFSRSPYSADMIAGRADAAMSDVFNETLLNVAGGGAPHARALQGPAWPSLVSQRWASDIIDSISGEADTVFRSLVEDPSKITSATIDAARSSSADFRELWTELTTEMVKHHPITGTTDEVLALLQGSTRHGVTNVMDGIWTKIRGRHYDQLRPHIDDLYKTVENPTTRSLGIRIGRGSSSRVIQIPVVGRAFGFAGHQFGRLPGIEGLGSALYERAFPGLFANRISRAGAYGVKGLDDFMTELESIVKGNLPSGTVVEKFSPSEAEELWKALRDETFKFGDARMDEALDWLREQKKTRFFDEVREGARSIDTETGKMLKGKQYDPNYEFLHLKGGTKVARKRFLKSRADMYRKVNHAGKYTSEEAQRLGLAPITDAFQVAQLHYMDSASKITNAYFWQDLASNYGLMNNATVTGVDNLEAAARGVTEVPYGKLSEAFKQMVKDTGGKFYIPDEFHALGSKFDEMMDWSTANMGQFGRGFSKIINKFKALTTIPYPGFHIRNFMGDTMMGMLDGVNPAHYTEVMTKYLKSRHGMNNMFKIFPGMNMSFHELMQMFREEANSGFIHIDLGTQATKTVGKIGGIGRRVVNTAKEFSDDRELLPRLTHYLQALRDESQALYRSGMRDTEAIMKQARDAALWRVNHYKFDYNALMPWERTLKSTVFPFYTYGRKAIPTLMEQMMINPRYFTAINRLQMNNDGSAADAFNYMNMPTWVRDFGYNTITDEANPLVMTGEMFPTNVLDPISSNSWGEVAGDMISQMNPGLQIPAELFAQKTAFDNRPIQGGTMDYLMSKIPFIGDIQSRFSNVPGVPGTSEHPISGGGWSWDKFLNDRLLGLGLGVRRISEQQQQQQMETNYDTLVDDPVTNFNHSQDRWSISMTADGIFQITDKISGQPIGQKFPTPGQAIQFAASLPSFQQPNIPMVNRPPSRQDISQVYQSLTQ